MKIAIATDHNGVNEKKEIIKFLIEKNYEVIDYSPENTPTDDYPDYAKLVCESITSKTCDLGILMCGTGLGMSIAANKVKGIYCARVFTSEEAKLAKEHNNANVIALSYKKDINDIKDILFTFIETSFTNEERHIRRIQKIKDME